MGATRLNGANSAILQAVYPVGAIYLSTASTSPATLFGGTWERITGRFLLAATDGGAGGNSTASAAAGKTGGEASHTLSAAESGVPAHGHGMQGHTHSTALGSHSHRVSGGGYRLERGKASYGGTNSGNYAPWFGGGYSAVDDVYAASADLGTKTSGGPSVANTANNTAASASNAHNNMPPYLAVYVWKRTA